MLNFRTLAGRPYSIYTDNVTLPDANGVLALNPAVWTRLVHQAIPPVTDGTTTYSTTFLVAEEFVGSQFFYVRHGLPLNLVRVSIPGVGDLDVGSGGLNGTLRLPSGASITVGPTGGGLTFPGGGPTVNISTTGAITVSGVGALVAGQTVTIGSATVAVDAAGNVVITDGGTQVTLNAGGGGSILFPGGIGIAVDALGRIGLVTSGVSPIIARVLDTANRVLNGDQLGAAIVLADILGVETRIPTPFGDIDIAALTQGGLLGLGIERGNSVFVLTKPKPKIEFVRDQDDDHNVNGSDPAVAVLRIGHWGADRTDGGLTGYTEGTFGTPRNELSPDNFIDQDSDRFYVRLRAPSANTDNGAVETVLVKLGTAAASGADDDQANDLTLRETAADSGVFVSEAQLLVGPNVPFSSDDAFLVRSAITSLPRSDDTRDDRTHRAEVHGSATAVYRVGTTDHSATAPVFNLDPSERHVLHVALTIFNEPWQDTNGNGQFDAGEPFANISGGATTFASTNPENRGRIWSDEQVDVQMVGLRSVLASAGIVVVEDARRVVDPVGKLFQQPDAAGNQATTALFDVARDRNDQSFPSRDHQLINANFRSASHGTPATGDDVLDVYFVPPFDEAGWGFSFFPKSTSLNPAVPAAYLDSAFVSYGAATETIPTLLDHEVLHHLTNQGDTVTPRHIVFPNSNGSASQDGASPSWQRRMQAATAAKARALRPDADLLAEGNSLLRTP